MQLELKKVMRYCSSGEMGIRSCNVNLQIMEELRILDPDTATGALFFFLSTFESSM